MLLSLKMAEYIIMYSNWPNYSLGDHNYVKLRALSQSPTWFKGAISLGEREPPVML